MFLWFSQLRTFIHRWSFPYWPVISHVFVCLKNNFRTSSYFAPSVIPFAQADWDVSAWMPGILSLCMTRVYKAGCTWARRKTMGIPQISSDHHRTSHRVWCFKKPLPVVLPMTDASLFWKVCGCPPWYLGWWYPRTTSRRGEPWWSPWEQPQRGALPSSSRGAMAISGSEGLGAPWCPMFINVFFYINSVCVSKYSRLLTYLGSCW